MVNNKSKQVELRKENKAKENKVEEKPKYIEKRTLEDLLKDLRIEKNWTYYNVLEELANRNVIIREETVKKWEYGLEYPDLDMIYRLADIYGIPSEDFIIAKNNSFKEGFESIHMFFIKNICYATGVSLKIGYITMYVIIGLALLGALMFFIGKCSEYLAVRNAMN